MNNQVFLAYTPAVMMLIGYGGTTQLDRIKQSIPALLEQTSENSIVSTTAFKKMQKTDGDINVLFSLATILEACNNSQLNSNMPQGINPKDIQMLGSFSFDKGKISMKYENFSDNPEVQAMNDRQKKATCTIENSFMKCFPQSTLIYFTMGINGEEFYNLLLENQVFQKNVPIAQTKEVKEVFAAFQKDIAVGLLNITVIGVPTFLLHAHVKSAAPVQMLYENRKKLGIEILKLDENEYVLNAGNESVYFGVRCSDLYVTNDGPLHKGTELSPSFKDTEFASHTEGKRAAFVINAEALLALPAVQMFTLYAGTQYAIAVAMADKIASIEVTGDSNNSVAIIQLKDRNVNALKQIVNLIKEFAGI